MRASSSAVILASVRIRQSCTNFECSPVPVNSPRTMFVFRTSTVRSMGYTKLDSRSASSVDSMRGVMRPEPSGACAGSAPSSIGELAASTNTTRGS